MDLIPFSALLFIVVSISSLFLFLAIYHGKKETFKFSDKKIRKELLYKGKLTLGSFFGYILSSFLLVQALILFSIVIIFRDDFSQNFYSLLILIVTSLSILIILWIKKLCFKESTNV